MAKEKEWICSEVVLPAYRLLLNWVIKLLHLQYWHAHFNSLLYINQIKLQPTLKNCGTSIEFKHDLYNGIILVAG